MTRENEQRTDRASLDMFGSVIGTRLPLGLILLAIYLTDTVSPRRSAVRPS